MQKSSPNQAMNIGDGVAVGTEEDVGAADLLSTSFAQRDVDADPAAPMTTSATTTTTTASDDEEGVEKKEDGTMNPFVRVFRAILTWAVRKATAPPCGGCDDNMGAGGDGEVVVKQLRKQVADLKDASRRKDEQLMKIGKELDVWHVMMHQYDEQVAVIPALRLQLASAEAERDSLRRQIEEERHQVAGLQQELAEGLDRMREERFVLERVLEVAHRERGGLQVALASLRDEEGSDDRGQGQGDEGVDQA